MNFDIVSNVSAAYAQTTQATVKIDESNRGTKATIEIQQSEAYYESQSVSIKQSEGAVYEKNENAVLTDTGYKVDMDTVNAMKEETDRRMFDLFKQTINSSFLKQVGGLRGILERILNGEEVKNEEGQNITIEITEESIAQAKEDVAEGGYWSAEETSDRFLEFAKALSGGDKSKADLLIDAFKEGYAAAQDLWGGELPELSQRTYDMTLEKFDAWKEETDSKASV